MSAEFVLREMQPSDAVALKSLMENDPEEPGQMSMTTVFLVDPYQAWSALKPSMIGVVAEVPDHPGELAGTATVAFFDIQFNGQVLPAAFLENLKVHHAYRGRGLGTQLAQWRVALARQRFGDQGIILTGTNSNNTASLATMKKWCNQFVGPISVLPYRGRDSAPPLPEGLTVRPAAPEELAEIATRANQFYADYNLYALTRAEALDRLLKGALKVYHYRVAVDASGRIVAGVLLSDRSTLMVDEFRNVPPPVLEGGMLPPDLRLRLMEIGGLWFETLPAGQYLWESVRWEFRERINSISAGIDPRSPLNAVFGADRLPVKIEITVALNAPAPADTEKALCHLLRG
jgi:GNAT superfamily N-acetyltransferase